jgi:hypothetical protein
MPLSDNIPSRAEVDRFIVDKIDSVPHLEATLLLWRHPSEHWTAESVAKRLWIEPEDARAILHDLARNQLVIRIARESEEYTYQAEPANDRMLRGIADVYRQEMIRISRMIHAKPSSAVWAFARAFRFKKEQE